jgi:hypothetical protein
MADFDKGHVVERPVRRASVRTRVQTRKVSASVLSAYFEKRSTDNMNRQLDLAAGVAEGSDE